MDGEQTPQETSQLNKGGMKKALVGLVVLAAIVLVGFYLVSQNGGLGSSAGNGKQSLAAVAIVNGEEITKDQYNELFSRLELNLRAQGVDTASETIQNALGTETMNGLITQVLLLQKASNLDVRAADEEVLGLMAQVREPFSSDEEYYAALQSQGLSEAILRELLTKQVVVQKTIERLIDPALLAVTEEEVQARYDSMAANSEEEAPSFSEVSGQLEVVLRNEKFREQAGILIKTFRDESEIEILI